MSLFYADLHIHSRFSRATGKNCNLPELALWGRKKGLALLGTGDFTHPEWFRELRQMLSPAEPGLFRLSRELECSIEKRLPGSCRKPVQEFGQITVRTDHVRFILQTEVSTIYKKGGRTRKVHHLIFVDSFDSAERIISRLSRTGNISSDGRPILGIDSRNLLEIVLESGEGSYLIPAHIWTPWFSVLGSSSGFDSIEECYEDLGKHIFALETGLSSDPPMNWRLSALDRYRLVSNSDAHSPQRLGRECCIFSGEMEYCSIKTALMTGKGYIGTIEFYPEEGKYHFDGHRACNVRLEPFQTKKAGGKCPKCGKDVTIGVMHRVCELADREEGESSGNAQYWHLIPLEEILSEIIQSGVESRKVQNAYEKLQEIFGPEIPFMHYVDTELLRTKGYIALAEAFERIRTERVIREPGYDGEYGTIKVFNEAELSVFSGQSQLFQFESEPTEITENTTQVIMDDERTGDDISIKRLRDFYARKAAEKNFFVASENSADGLDTEQRKAVSMLRGPLLILAGPGSGKTFTLTMRIARLILDRHVKPEKCLAVTFTRRAAEEMRLRLAKVLGDTSEKIPIMTLHALGYSILNEFGHYMGLSTPLRVLSEFEKNLIFQKLIGVTPAEGMKLQKKLSNLIRTGGKLDADDEITRIYRLYREYLNKHGLVDFDGLISLAVDLFDCKDEVRKIVRGRYDFISVDEFQDIDEMQYRFIKLVTGEHNNICVIGDPNQSIYGFRGASPVFCERFVADYPGVCVIQLVNNYRSNRVIAEAGRHMSCSRNGVSEEFQASIEPCIFVYTAENDRTEAEFVASTIIEMIGGIEFIRERKGDNPDVEYRDISFGDIAVLSRTDIQLDIIQEALSKAGIPVRRFSHSSLYRLPMVKTIVDRILECKDINTVYEVLRQQFSEQSEENAGYEEKRIREIILKLARESQTPQELVSHIVMGFEIDLLDPEADCVSLMTLHASKGLEFDVVFITGCEDGILPLKWNRDDTEDIDEERRLFFVGMTRAKRRLFLTNAQRRKWRGRIRRMLPSPFLGNIPAGLFVKIEYSQENRGKAFRGKQLTLFSE
jgi:uncharacterized protein (TIGR00375 family)